MTNQRTQDKIKDSKVDYNNLLKGTKYSSLSEFKLFDDFPFLLKNYSFPACFYEMHYYINFGTKNIGYFDFIAPNGNDRIIAHDKNNVNSKYHNLSLSKIDSFRIYSQNARHDKSYTSFEIDAYNIMKKYTRFGNIMVDDVKCIPVSTYFDDNNKRVFKKHYNYLFHVACNLNDLSNVRLDNYINYDFDDAFIHDMYFYFDGSGKSSRQIYFKDFLIYILSNGNFEYFKNNEALQFFASYGKTKERKYFKELKKSFDLIDKFRVGEFAYEAICHSAI